MICAEQGGRPEVTDQPVHRVHAPAQPPSPAQRRKLFAAATPAAAQLLLLQAVGRRGSLKVGSILEKYASHRGD